MNLSLQFLDTAQLEPFEKKGFELTFRLLQKDSRNYGQRYG